MIMKRTKMVIAILLLVVCGAVGIIVLSQLTVQKRYPGDSAQLTIGISSNHSSWLIWIAEERGYFTENGLNVTTKLLEAGKDAVIALLDGNVDVAAAAEYVLVGNAINEKKIQAVVSIAKIEFQYLIGRKDLGILNVSDLKGKKVGVTRQTSAEFYLGRYLQLHNISLHDVTLVDLKPTQLGGSLTTGEVDAVLAWDPYAYTIEKNLGGNALIRLAQSGQTMYWLLVCRSDFITRHPELIDRLLRSFDQAEKFAANNPDQARKILQKRLNVEEAYVERIWPKTRMGLSLDQGLIIAMEDESRFMIDNNLVNNRQMPYYPDYIHWQGLEKVKPESVTVIR
jgi:NitT/TauT family transport system substrate-binding protein